MIIKKVVILTNGKLSYEIEMCVFKTDSFVIKGNRFALSVCHYPCYESHMRSYDSIVHFPTQYELEDKWVNKINEIKNMGYE